MLKAQMNFFISHNKADKATARLLAMSLVAQGASVWLDEWKIRPGDSITGAIEDGLASTKIFVLVWSKKASKSRWVTTELRAYLRRRVDDETLRIVPVVLDTTALPTLVADYKGFKIDKKTSISTIAFELTGQPADVEIARQLQNRLSELTLAQCGKDDPLPYIICPSCGSEDLKRSSLTDPTRDELYYVIDCKKCNWRDWTQ